MILKRSLKLPQRCLCFTYQTSKIAVQIELAERGLPVLESKSHVCSLSTLHEGHAILDMLIMLCVSVTFSSTHSSFL
jgi:hypothetical protein